MSFLLGEGSKFPGQMSDFIPGRLDLFAYAAIAGLAIKLAIVENKDVTCPYLDCPKKECEVRGGMSFSDTHPEEGDSPKRLKQKVAKAIKHESHSIKWRRSLVISILAMTFLMFLVLRRILPWQSFYLGVLVIYFFVFGQFNYFSFHVSNEAEKRGLASLQKLYDELKPLKR